MSQLRSLPALRMHIPGYSCAHGLLCEVPLYELHYESPGCCCTRAPVPRHHGSVTWGYVMATLWLIYGCCYSCCASQERENASVVPTAPCIFFQPLGSSFAYPRISEQSEHQDNWHHEQDQQHKGLPWWLSGKESACQSRIQSLILEDPLSHRATKPIYHNHWACALKPGSCKHWAHVPQLLKPVCPRVQAPQ